MGTIEKRQIGHQDIHWWDGTSASDFTSTTSTSRSVTLDDIGANGPYYWNKLIITKTMVVKDEPSATPVILVQASGDTTYRCVLYNSGKFEWGEGGTSARDVNLYRSASGILKTDDELNIGASLRVGGGIYASASLRVVDNIYVEASLKFSDANLYHGATNVLKTDDLFQSSVGIITKGYNTSTATAAPNNTKIRAVFGNGAASLRLGWFGFMRTVGATPYLVLSSGASIFYWKADNNVGV